MGACRLPTPAAEEISQPQRGAALPVAAAVLGYAVFLFAPQVLNDGDTYWHLAAGDWILAHLTVPATDPFSNSMAGATWVAHEWLSEVVMALAFRLGGWSGLVILFGLASALLFGLLARHLVRSVPPLPALLLWMLAAACVGPSLLARPHVLALPVLELWTAGLLRARRHGRAPSPLMLPLMPLWANLHGGFMFGLALILPFAAEAVMAAGAAWRAAARRWGLFAVAALAGASLSPNGFRGLLFPFQLMRLSYLSNITEWSATNFQHFQPIELALMAFLYVALTRGVRLPPVRLLILLSLMHMALQHSRHQMLAGLVGALVLADPLSGMFPPRTQTASATGPRRIAVLVAGVGLCAGLTVLRIAAPLQRVDAADTPMTALAHVPPDLAQAPVFNDYGFGGYLIFKGVRPFVDGRTDLYGDAFLAAYDAARSNGHAFETLATAYHIGWTMLRAGTPEVDMLDGLPGWHRLYADGIAVIHVRAAAPP